MRLILTSFMLDFKFHSGIAIKRIKKIQGLPDSEKKIKSILSYMR